MPIFLYRCQSCGGVHQVSARPEGAVYLRCVVARQWAWHDASHFLTPEEPPAAARRARRASAKGKRAGAKSPARRVSAAAKKTAPKRAARKAPAARTAKKKGTPRRKAR